MKRVLITGANGFIGTKIYERFEEKGYEVMGWDIVANDATKKIKCFNMACAEDVYQEINEYRPDIVIHCAGSADVGRSVQNPDTDYVGNVTLTHNILFGLHRAALDHVRFVFLSSAAVYGNPASLPITEEMALNPLSPYAVHKVMCESLCTYFAKNYGMDVKIARIFSAYGKGLMKQIFWDMYKKAKQTGELRMFGTGNEMRDYIHVDDVIHSLYLLATSSSNEIVYNVANGEGVSIRAATEMFANCVQIPTEKISFNGVVREGDPLKMIADISKMINIGYKKTRDMQEALQAYIEWASQL